MVVVVERLLGGSDQPAWSTAAMQFGVFWPNRGGVRRAYMIVYKFNFYQ